MSIIARIGKNWHPLARLNILIVLVFFVIQVLAILSILIIPNSLDSGLAELLISIGYAWICGIALCVVWVIVNAIWMTWGMFVQRNLTPISWRNVGVAWSAPLFFVIMVIIWSPAVSYVADYRINQDFESSRETMLDICNDVLIAGLESEYIEGNYEIGAYRRVDIRYDDGWVYFNLGDSRREYGYICLPEDSEFTDPNDGIYDYETIDDRFVNYNEIENDLTPQPDVTETPEDSVPPSGE